jgi:peptidoglycan/LPS O-acetylase OafA/YrhL
MLVPVLLAAAASWYLVERPLITWAARPRRGQRAGRSGQAQLEARAAP